MASGDTKTEALLNVLGNGGSIEGITGCGNTKTQNYIIDAIGRIQHVEDEVEEIKNNPDVVDIVDTYADLQAYDTSKLTDKDVIRVLADETHGGNSAYYRWNATTSQFDFIGEISGGNSTIFYISTDLDMASYDQTPVTLYTDEECSVAATSSEIVEASESQDMVRIVYMDLSDSDYHYVGSYILAQALNESGVLMWWVEGTAVTSYSLDFGSGPTYSTAIAARGVSIPTVVQTTGSSTTDVMSQKAVTDIVGDVESILDIINNGSD